MELVEFVHGHHCDQFEDDLLWEEVPTKVKMHSPICEPVCPTEEKLHGKQNYFVFVARQSS